MIPPQTLDIMDDELCKNACCCEIEDPLGGFELEVGSKTERSGGISPASILFDFDEESISFEDVASFLGQPISEGRMDYALAKIGGPAIIPSEEDLMLAGGFAGLGGLSNNEIMLEYESDDLIAAEEEAGQYYLDIVARRASEDDDEPVDTEPKKKGTKRKRPLKKLKAVTYMYPTKFQVVEEGAPLWKSELKKHGASLQPKSWLGKLHGLLSDTSVQARGAAAWVKLSNNKTCDISDYGIAISQRLVDHFGHGKVFQMSNIKSARHQLTELSFFHADTYNDPKDGTKMLVYAVPGLSANMPWDNFCAVIAASLKAKTSAQARTACFSQQMRSDETKKPRPAKAKQVAGAATVAAKKKTTKKKAAGVALAAAGVALAAAAVAVDVEVSNGASSIKKKSDGSEKRGRPRTLAIFGQTPLEKRP